MNLVIFYEKPGCLTNEKQKMAFRDSGYKVIERDLLNHGMSEEELFQFIKNMPVTKWFNPNAPQIKSGEVVPVKLNEKEALTLVTNNPILLRRPLLIIGNKKLCGFNQWFMEKTFKVKLNTKVSNQCVRKAEKH
ncbi:MAG: nitrogenase-associated protein [Sulfurimonas sp.]|jgi:nitrogenase-associated protein|uniref:ArsC/Spx/MgsR family protein n=1 Tax=Sulfurimonas sp. TaxID=2022749 RepID=UPI0039E3AE48